MSIKIIKKKVGLTRKHIAALTVAFDCSEKTIERWYVNNEDIITSTRFKNVFLGVNEIKNDYQCPSALWRKFTTLERENYNRILGKFLPLQNETTALKTQKLTEEEWAVLVHNFAVQTISILY